MENQQPTGVAKPVTKQLEKAYLAAMNDIASAIAEEIIGAESMPTVDEFKDLVSQKMDEQKEFTAPSIAANLTLELLDQVNSKKVNVSAMLGMLKGKCTQANLPSRLMFELDNLVKSITNSKVSESVLTESGIRNCLKSAAAAFPTKLANALANFYALFGIGKGQAIEEFSAVESELTAELVALLEKYAGLIWTNGGTHGVNPSESEQ